MPQQRRACKRPIKPCAHGAHAAATEHNGMRANREVGAADGPARAREPGTDRAVDRVDRLLQPGGVDRREDRLQLRGEPRRASARGTPAQLGGNDDAIADRRFRGDPAGDRALGMQTAPDVVSAGAGMCIIPRLDTHGMLPCAPTSRSTTP